MDVFAGKTVIVTGAASGMGRALSEELAGRGANVILTDINAEPLEEAAASLGVCPKTVYNWANRWNLRNGNGKNG